MTETDPLITGTITVYRLGDGSHPAVPIHKTRLERARKSQLLRILKAVREGLPPDCGATLTDERGYGIR